MLPPLPPDLFADNGDEAPHVDSCRPHGIPIDRTLCPPDDHITDLFASLAASIDAGCITLDDVGVAVRPSSTAPSTSPRSARPTPLPDGTSSPSGRGDWWNGVPL